MPVKASKALRQSKVLEGPSAGCQWGRKKEVVHKHFRSFKVHDHKLPVEVSAQEALAALGLHRTLPTQQSVLVDT